MKLSRFIPVLAFVLLLLSVAPSTAYSADSLKKSIVLKEAVPLERLFYFPRDNSVSELWDAFMLVKKANSGDANAQHELGLWYLTGRQFTPDTGKAVQWIQKAAAQNLVPARYNLGILLNNGWGVSWNPFEAYRHFRYAAEHKMPEAQYVYGLLLTDNLIVPRNYSEAYRWIIMAADSGYGPAKEVLVEFKKRGIAPSPGAQQSEDSLYNQQGTSRQDSSATLSFSPILINFAADSVHEPDDDNLLREALLEHLPYDEKSGSMTTGKPDNSTIELIRRAAEAGSPEALTVMGRWHETGSALEQNELLASVYYLRAIRSDSRWASMLLWKLIRKENYFARLQSRAGNNDPIAKFVWSELISSGFDGQLTEAQALQFLRDAGQRYPEALLELGMCYYNGKWVTRDTEKGKSLLQQAAQKGNSEAKVRLWILELRENEKTAHSAPVDSLQRASWAGSNLAQAMLGYCYQKGIGVPLDLTRSVYYYRKAAQRGSATAYNALKELYAAIRPNDPQFRIEE